MPDKYKGLHIVHTPSLQIFYYIISLKGSKNMADKEDMDTKKVQTQEDENVVTKMVIDLLKRKGFTFANFETVVAHVKSHYENNATI
jgi:hypothetical protein